MWSGSARGGAELSFLSRAGSRGAAGIAVSSGASSVSSRRLGRSPQRVGTGVDAPSARYGPVCERPAQDRGTGAASGGPCAKTRTPNAQSHGPAGGCRRDAVEVQDIRAARFNQGQAASFGAHEAKHARLDAALDGIVLVALRLEVRGWFRALHLRARDGARRSARAFRDPGHGADVHSGVWRDRTNEGIP